MTRPNWTSNRFRPWRRTRWLWLVAVCTACGAASRGDRAFRGGDAQEAVRLYARAEALSTAQQQRYARALLKTGQEQEATARVARIEEGALTPDGWLVKGMALMEQGRPQEAARAFEAGAEAGGDAALWVNRCGALLAAGTPDAEVCSEALLRAPEDPSAMLGLAAAAAASQNPVVAGRALESLLRLPDLRWEQRLEAARVYRAMGDAWTACEALVAGVEETASPDPQKSVLPGVAGAPLPSQAESARESPPSPVEPDDDSRLEWGRICAAAGHWNGAHLALEPLVDRRPVASFVLGTLALERVLRTGPGAERERWIADAERRFSACEESHEDDPDYWNNVGRLRAVDEEWEQAEAAFRRALALDPHHAHARLNLARQLQVQGRLEEARRWLEQLWNSDSPYAMIAGLELARSYRDSGDLERGLERGREVLATCEAGGVMPCIAEAGVFLATVEAGIGHEEQALDHLEQALATGQNGLRDRIRVEPDLHVIRDTPRYKELMDDSERVGSPFPGADALPEMPAPLATDLPADIPLAPPEED